jgi:hypothetical protein
LKIGGVAIAAPPIFLWYSFADAGRGTSPAETISILLRNVGEAAAGVGFLSFLIFLAKIHPVVSTSFLFLPKKTQGVSNEYTLEPA